MRRLVRLSRNVFLVALVATPLPALTACSDPSLTAELRQDELAYNNSVAQLAMDQEAGNATAAMADEHQVKLAVTKLRNDRGIVSGPNEHEHQEKQGHSKP